MLYDLEKVIEHSLRLFKKMMTGPIVNNTPITIREKKGGKILVWVKLKVSTTTLVSNQ